MKVFGFNRLGLLLLVATMTLGAATAFFLVESIGLWALPLMLPLSVFAGVGTAAIQRLWKARS